MKKLILIPLLLISTLSFAQAGQVGGNGKMTVLAASKYRMQAVMDYVLSKMNTENQQKTEFKNIYTIGYEDGTYHYVVEIMKSGNCSAHGVFVTDKVISDGIRHVCKGQL